ncbi:MAG TPA: NADPH-dependent 7-cyano-7-deazaguanine reductase QueF [Gammaproteobacteria bacterium]|nr:NADPH-dependent 7-cyano-7-deazaguanine reductase QueF [Gammaproteobacteria bacterium]
MLHHTPLGQATVYIETYTPSLLVPIARPNPREFFGYDLWHGYEVSWLDPQGKPCVASAEFIFPCASPYLIESKSFKLYLNSFNQTPVESSEALQQLLIKDLSAATGAPVLVRLKTLAELTLEPLQRLTGIYLDEIAIACDTYKVQPDYLHTQENEVTQTVYSHLLKSNCPVTNQPDWGSIEICYRGKQIHHADLLRYIVSFRNHQDFHEQCVERIYTDILQRCKPSQLKVSAFYTRRGGLDINPVRANYDIPIEPRRLGRQ